MKTLSSNLDPRSDAFRRNAGLNSHLAGELREKVAKAALGGPQSLARPPRRPGQAFAA